MKDFIDIRKISDVRLEMECVILMDNRKRSTGIIDFIRSKKDEPDGLYVVLKNGDSGNIIKITNSTESIKNRILSESHTSENKLNFYEPVMQDEQIPHTVQAFLNGNGGYLYIGVFDDAKTESEKLVGLSTEKKILEEKLIQERKLESGGKVTWLKFEDLYVDEIEKKLNKTLSSETNFGPLIKYKMRSIDDINILELNIKQCPTPVFYKHLNKKNKIKQFDIFFNNEKVTSRELDDFYYRDGSKKEPIYTFEEFYQYLKNRFM